MTTILYVLDKYIEIIKYMKKRQITSLYHNYSHCQSIACNIFSYKGLMSGYNVYFWNIFLV